jgi:vacuolar-type H+-ATPase subunit C/Vma6
MTDYTTSTARVSALSEQLLTLSQVERMLSAETAEDSFRILNDLSWASAVPDVSGVEEFERVITTGLYELKSTLMECTPSHELLRFLLFPFDLQNAKATLLASVRHIDYDDFREDLSSLSLYPRRTAYEILNAHRVLDGQGIFFSEALLKAKTILESDSENVYLAESILDGTFYHQMQRAVDSLKSNLLSEIFERLVDIENVKMVIRNRSKREVLFLLPKSNPEGYVLLTLEEARNRLEFSSAKSYLEEADKIFSEGRDFSEWEISTSLQVLDSLFWPSRINPLGMENIALFFWTKLRNAEVIRSILVRKRNNFSDEQIRKSISVFLPYLPMK